MKKLNLGCGEIKKEGYVNLDWQTIAKPDISHDLNKIPYPFKDNEFDEVYASHLLEHLDKVFNVMTELHRILKPDGTLIIKVPHFSRGFTHAEHCHGFDVTFPYYFNKNFTKSGFFGTEYELVKTELHWLAFFHLLENIGYSRWKIGILKIANYIVSFFANLNPHLCSRIWCYYVGGFDEIEFVFKAKKS